MTADLFVKTTYTSPIVITKPIAWRHPIEITPVGVITTTRPKAPLLTRVKRKWRKLIKWMFGI